MKAISLTIRNFLSYSDKKRTEILFVPGKNIIAGKNNVGKSATFHALQYLKGEIAYNQNDHFAGKKNDHH